MKGSRDTWEMSLEANRLRALGSASLVWGLCSGWTSQLFISVMSHDAELFCAHKHLITHITPAQWKPTGAFLSLESLVLISDSQFHGLGSPQLSPRFPLMNSELMLRKSCVLSGRPCFSRCQTHTQLPHQIVFKKRARPGKPWVSLQTTLWEVQWSWGSFTGSFWPSPSLPSPTLDLSLFLSNPYLPWNLLPLTAAPPTSRSRAWITGKCVSSHLKLSPGHSPKNNWFCPRGMLGNSSAYINHLLTTYL